VIDYGPDNYLDELRFERVKKGADMDNIIHLRK
jgi:hypothetical protein